MGNYTIFLDVRKSQERQTSKKFYSKCSENSRSRIILRTDVFRKLTLGAPDFSHRIIRPFAYNQSLQHPTIAVLLIKILIVFRPLSSVHLFRSNQSFEALENRFDQAPIISPNFHRLRWECLALLLTFCVINTKKNALQIMSLAAYANETKK